MQPTDPLVPADRTLAALAPDADDADEQERYTLLGQVGRGGTAEVWLAHDDHLGRDVALKRPRADRPDVGADALAAEAEILSRVRHPNIVPLYDLDISPIDGRPRFFTMPRLAGPTLREEAAAFHAARPTGAAGRAKFRHLVAAFRGVCLAVAHAHAQGVLHLDLKGDNVKLGADGEAVVIDWGMARPAKAGADRPGGTPGYVAPERAAGHPPAAAADIYGLGAVLYEVLTGRPPTPDPAAPPAPPRSIWSGVPRPLGAVCLKALARDPAARYPTADALREDLDRWVAGERVAAYREPVWGRVTRWLRQHDRTARGAAAGVTLAVVALAIGLVRVDRERAVAESALAAERESLRAALRAGHHSFAAADDALSDRDGTDADRRRLLDEYLAHTRGLLDRYRDDPDARLEVATAWCRVAFSHDRAGRWADALAALDEAAPLLAATDPGTSAETWALLIRSHTLSAWLLSNLGRGAEAEDRLARADGRVQAAQGFLAAHEHDRLSAEAVNIRGMITPDLAAGGALLLSAAERYDRLAAGPSSGPRDRPHAAFARLVAAVRFRDAGRPDEARFALTRARDGYDRLVAEWPSSRDFRQRAAACANMEGLLRADAGDHAGAVPWYERAVVLRRALVAANPTAPVMRMELATSLSNRGKSLRLSGRAADAAPAAREACDFGEGVFREQPEVVHYRASAGLFRVRAGQVGLALGRWDEAEADFRAALDRMAPLVARPGAEAAHRRTAAEAAVGLGGCHAGRGNWAAAWAAWANAGASGSPPPGRK